MNITKLLLSAAMMITATTFQLAPEQAVAAKGSTSGSAASSRPNSNSKPKSTAASASTSAPNSKSKSSAYSNRSLKRGNYPNNSAMKQKRADNGQSALSGNKRQGVRLNGSPTSSWAGWNRANSRQTNAAEQNSGLRKMDRNINRSVTFNEPASGRRDSVTSEVLPRLRREVGNPYSSKIINKSQMRRSRST